MRYNTSISNVPANENKTIFQTMFAGNSDIIKTIEKSLPVAVAQMKNASAQFVGKNVKNTCANIWYWLKQNVKYNRDDDDSQIIKLPSKLIADHSGDCKSLALFTGAVLKNLNIPFVFRYINQTGGTLPRHIYVVAYDENNSPVYIDVVHSAFNQEPNGIKYKKDYNYNTMNVSAIAGLNDPGSENYSQKRFINETLSGIYGEDEFFSWDTLLDTTGAVTSWGTDVKADASLGKKIANLFGGGSSAKDAGSGKPAPAGWGFQDFNFGKPLSAGDKAFVDLDDYNRKKATFETVLKGWPLWKMNSYDDYSKAMQKVADLYGMSTDGFTNYQDAVYNKVLAQGSPWTYKALLNYLSDYYTSGESQFIQHAKDQLGLNPLPPSQQNSSGTPGAGTNTNKTTGGGPLAENNTMKYILWGGLGLAVLGGIIYAVKK